MKKLHLTLLTALFALGLQVQASDEQDQVNQATEIIKRFKNLPEREIPQEILRDARGLAILTVVKGGFVWTAKIGSGVVVTRTAHGWSGPSFIRTAGAGFGAQIGGEVTELVLVLNTPEAVKAFSGDGNVTLGGNLSVAAGPLGRSASASVTRKAAVYSYSRSQGLYAGASLEGTVISTHKKSNTRYYHREVSSQRILAGLIEPPAGAARLLSKL